MKSMKRILLAVLSGGVVLASSVMAQEAPQKPREEVAKATKPEAAPSREQIRKELEALPPEQREARIKEMRERMKNSPEMQKLREEIMALPPEQREARMKEMREKFAKQSAPAPEAIKQESNNLTPEQRDAKMKETPEGATKAPAAADIERRREEFKKLSPEEREAKMKDFRAQFMTRRTELEKKKADGKITPEEEKALERMNEMAKRAGKGDEPRRPKAE